jgi:small neutral amino acid transporter SnatA (MarC family)
MWSSVFAMALTFFLIANPVGNSPTIIALVKDFDLPRQKKILFREATFALLFALFFQYFGEMFLGALNIKDYTLTITGGLLLLLVAYGMIFHDAPSENTLSSKQEPYIVPIATPILSGAGLMSVIMLFSTRERNDIKITSAILIAWIGIYFVLAIAPYMQKILGKRGLIALEQVMGLILALISMEMVVNGSALLLKTLRS